MSYLVKEVFYTLQGEGANHGRPAVFCRFSGCNLWTGREEHRSIAVCQFCDTDFVGTNGTGGGKFPTARSLVEAIQATWEGGSGPPFVVCTGGEPLLQIDAEFIEEAKRAGLILAIETNGTLPVPQGVDWICVSPKAGADWVQRQGSELKLVFPQPTLLPTDVEDGDFEHFYLQPMDGDNVVGNTQAAIAYCLEHPKWKLSVQTHKLLGIR